jgi:hypothetical protein
MNKKILVSTIVLFLLAIFGGIELVNKDVSNGEKFKYDISNYTNNHVDIEGIGKNNQEGKNMFIKVNDKVLTVALEDNSSAKALIEKLKQNDITINMEDYANFEKVGSLEFDLPTNDKQITTSYGDVILYQGNKITIYYDTNTWSFTKLGKINNVTQDELKDILGSKDVTVTLTMNR